VTSFSDPINLLLLIISGIFILLAMLVLSKGHDTVNLSFSLTPSIYAIWAVFDFFHRDATVYWLRLPLQLLFLVGPLGIFTAAVIIERSSYVLQDYRYWLFNSAYLATGLSLGTWSLWNEFSTTASTEAIALSRAFYNGVVIVPLISALYYFHQIRQRTPDLKNKLLLINSGLLLTSLAQLVNSISYYFTTTYNVLAYLLVIVGLLAAMLAFIQLPTAATDIP